MASSTKQFEPIPDAGRARGPGWPWARIRPCVFIVGNLLAGYLLCGASAYFVGKEWEDSRRFLKNYRAPNDYETQMAFVIDYALHADEKNDVVFLGDSTCQQGFVTKQFEEETGLRAFNLGSVALLGIEGYVVVLRAYLARHPRPKIVVFCIDPKGIQEKSAQRGPADALDTAGVLEQFMWSYGPGTEDMRPVHKNPVVDYFRLGTWVARGYLSGGFDHFADEPITGRSGMTCNTLRAALLGKRGYWEAPAVKTDSADDIGRIRAKEIKDRLTDPPRFLENAASIGPANLAALEKLIRLTQENDVLLLIRFPPVLPGAGPKDTRFVDAWPKDLEERFAKVIVSRPLILHADAAYFIDGDRCNREGAQKFTAFTAEEVRKALASRGN